PQPDALGVHAARGRLRDLLRRRRRRLRLDRDRRPLQRQRAVRPDAADHPRGRGRDHRSRAGPLPDGRVRRGSGALRNRPERGVRGHAQQGEHDERGHQSREADPEEPKGRRCLHGPARALRSQERVYSRIVKLAPGDSASLLLAAQTATYAQDYKTATSAYNTCVKKFPTDPSLPYAKQQLKTLKALSGVTATPVTTGKK